MIVWGGADVVAAGDGPAGGGEVGAGWQPDAARAGEGEATVGSGGDEVAAGRGPACGGTGTG